MYNDTQKVNLKSFDEKALNDVKSKITSDIVNNPKFDDFFIKELNYLYYKTSNDNIEIQVSFDKKSVSIISNSPVIDCTKEEFRGKNRAYICSKIYPSGENMYLEYSQGVVFDRKALEEKGIKSSATYESKFETNYILRCINKDGVEYSNSSFTDSYPLSKKIDEVDLREQTLSSFHKPTFYEYMLPKSPIHVLKAKIRNTYRKAGDFALIHVNVAEVTSDGYKDVSCALFTTHPLFPAMLRGDKIIAKATEKNGDYIFTIEENYAPSIEKGYERAKIDLKESVEAMKNELDERTYHFLMNNI